MSLLLILFNILLLMLETSDGIVVSDVYRMFQLEKAGTPFGSQRVSVNLLSTSTLRSGSLSKYIVVLPLKEFNLEVMEDILIQRSAEALLILLPKDPSEISATLQKNWRNYEQELIRKELKAPVYFAYEDDTTKSLYKEVLTASTRPEIIHFIEFLESLVGSQDQYQLVVSDAEATPIQDISLANYQGWLAGAGGINTEGQTLPTIAIVAYYDTFNVAPSLAFGADTSASGVVALLELARLFNKLYDSPKTQGKYNILFVLSGGGTLNFLGTEKWLSSADSRLLDTIEFAICLDTIGNEKELNLHVSKIPKEDNIIKLYNNFNKTASSMKIPFQIIHKKINISNPDIDWEHEQFSRKRIVAATLSHLNAPTPPFSRSNLFDTKVNLAILERNIKFIAESLAKHVYGHNEKEFEVFAGSLAVNSHFIKSWMDALTSFPRFAPLIPLDSPLLIGLQKVLEDYTGAVTNQTFPLESEYTFYGTTKASLSAYRVKPYAFDIILSFLVAIYLSLLYVTLKGPTEAIRSVKKLFAKSDKKVYKKKEK